MNVTKYLKYGIGYLAVFITLTIVGGGVSSSDQSRDIAIVEAQGQQPIPLHTYMPEIIIIHNGSGPHVYFEGQVPTSSPETVRVIVPRKTKMPRNPSHHSTNIPKTFKNNKVVIHRQSVKTQVPGPIQTDAFFVKGM